MTKWLMLNVAWPVLHVVGAIGLWCDIRAFRIDAKWNHE